jgi:hypothetical protein
MPARSMLAFLALAALLGALAAGGWARLYFAHARPTFRCKVRWPDESLWMPVRWPRRKVRAAWVHDVLLVQRGIVRPRTVALAAGACHRAIRTADRCEVARLGTDPVVLSVRLDDWRTVEVAARRRDTAALAGPFVAAAMRSLPEAPNEPRPRGG